MNNLFTFREEHDGVQALGVDVLDARGTFDKKEVIRVFKGTVCEISNDLLCKGDNPRLTT